MGAPLTSYLPRVLLEWYAEAPAERHRVLEGSMVFADVSGFTALSEKLAQRGKVGAEDLTGILDHAFTRLLAVAYENAGSLLKFGGDALLLYFRGDQHEQRAAHSAFGMRDKLFEINRSGEVPVELGMTVGVHRGAFDAFLVGRSHRELVLAGPEVSRVVATESAAERNQVRVSPEIAAHLRPEVLGGEPGGGFLLTGAPRLPRVGTEAFIPERDIAEPRDLVPEALRLVLTEHGGSEHRRATIAFLHLDGTDELTRRGRAAEAADAIDEVVTAAQDAAARLGVTFLSTDVDDDGAKIILTAGVPTASGNDEERMLRAARAIIDAGTTVPVRIGVHTGRVFAGVVGPPYRTTYTVIGDAVNLAARVMARAGPREVLATPEVLNASRTLFAIRELEPFQVKGKRLPVTAIAVGAASGLRQTHTDRRYALVGRQRELDRLVDAVAEAQSGTGTAVQVVGDAGLGKSRLVGELQERFPAARFVLAAADQYESTSPYASVRRLLSAFVGVDLEGGRDTIRLLAPLVAERAPELEPWLPLVAHAFGEVDVDETRETRSVAAPFRARRTREVLVDLLAMLRGGPVVLVIEDAHWLDDASADTLRTLVQRVLGHRPWAVVVTSRQPFDGIDTILELSPLDRQAANVLAHQAAEQGLIRLDQVDELTARAGGNPLFLQELLASAGASDDLPDSIEGLVTARVDALPVDDRAVLRLAAVVGQHVDCDLVEELVAGELGTAEVAWERLGAFLTEVGAGTVAFRHALLRDAAYEALPYRQRRRLHGAVADALEVRDPREQQLELRALHAFRAGRYDDAWHFGRRAAHRALRGHATTSAVPLFRQALAAARHVPGLESADVSATWEALGDALVTAGSYDDATDALRRARRLAPDAAQPRLLRKQGVVRERLGAYSQALRWYTRGMNILDEGLEAREERAQLLLAAALARLRQGRADRAAELIEQVLPDATGRRDAPALARAYTLLAWAAEDAGDARAAEHRRTALELYEELDDLHGQAMVVNNEGIAAYFGGDWPRALACYARTRELLTRIGDQANAAIAATNMGETLADQGRYDEAAVQLAGARSVLVAAQHTFGVALTTMTQGRLAARRGRWDEAEALLGQALRAFEGLPNRDYAAEATARLAELALFRGETGLALVQVQRVRDALASRSAALDALLARVAGCAHLLAGRFEQARGELDRSVRRAREGEVPYEIALGLVARAELTAHAAETEGDADALRAEAQAILGRLDVVAPPRELVLGATTVAAT